MSDKIKKLLTGPSSDGPGAPAVFFTKKRTISTEYLVQDENLVQDEEDGNNDEEEIRNDSEHAVEDPKVHIITNSVKDNQDADTSESRPNPSEEKKKFNFWDVLKWIRDHLKFRKLFGRGMTTIGRGFMYTTPMSATIVFAQGAQRNATTHYF